MLVDPLRFILAILAIFRIARFLPLDDGPLYVFERMRLLAKERAETENDELGFWHNFYDAITCPYCQGLYIAFLCIPVVFPTKKSKKSDILLLAFALAGGQTILQKWTER